MLKQTFHQNDPNIVAEDHPLVLPTSIFLAKKVLGKQQKFIFNGRHFYVNVILLYCYLLKKLFMTVVELWTEAGIYKRKKILNLVFYSWSIA